MSASSPTQATGESSDGARHFSLDTTEVGIWELISNDDSEGSPWFLSWEILIGGFLVWVCFGWKKREKQANLFFCFGNWVWPVSLSKCYPFKRFRGKLVAHASVSVMWREMFRQAPLLYDGKTTRRSLRLWHIEDESTLHFCLNWGCLCRIWQLADVSLSEGVDLKWT